MVNLSNKLDLNLLNVFLEVYRLQSITLAAESMNMTQPGVSGALKRLQEQLGTELFVREGRGISATHAAVQLADQVEPALRGVSAAVSNLRQFDPEQEHHFRILVNEMALLKLQPLAERDTSLKKVSLAFHMVSSSEEATMQALSMQKADLAIDVYKPNERRFGYQQVLSDDLVLIARHKHPAIKGALTKEAYYRHKHITLRLRRQNQYAVDFFTPDALGERKVSAECDSLITMFSLVAAGDCIGVTLRSMAQRYAQQFDLQVMDLPFESVPAQQYMIWHQRTELSSAHQWLRKKVASYMSKQ